MAEKPPEAKNRGKPDEAPQPPGDRWAVIIGISEYENESLNLRYAHRDAEELYELIRTPAGGGFQKQKIQLLLNRDASRRNVTRALRTFLQRPAPEDLVLIYLACHGAPDPNRPNVLYLLTHDVDPDDISGTALPMREIDDALRENLHAERVVMIADTCHSAGIGGSVGRRSAADASDRMNQYLRELSLSKPGLALLTSAEANEVSFEDARWGGGHGVFTHYLLEGMRGAADIDKNGIVSVGELFEYVRDSVKTDTANQQHPAIGTNAFDRKLPLAIPGVNRASELHDKALELFDTGEFNRASRVWEEALQVYPGHRGAAKGLARIEARERKKQKDLERRQRELFKLKRARQLTVADYAMAMELLEKNPDEFSQAERDTRDLVDELTDGNLTLSAYLQSVKLVQTQADWERQQAEDEQRAQREARQREKERREAEERERQKKREAERKEREKREAEERQRQLLKAEQELEKRAAEKRERARREAEERERVAVEKEKQRLRTAPHIKPKTQQTRPAKIPSAEAATDSEPGIIKPLAGGIVVLLALLGVWQAYEFLRPPVPDVRDQSLDAATLVLADAGLRVGNIQRSDAEDDRVGQVLNQEPSPGIRTTRGNSIDLTIGVKAAIPARSVIEGLKPEMVPVAGGAFKMGSPETEAGQDDDEDLHDIEVGDFAIGKYEVTVADYRKFIDALGAGDSAEGCYTWAGGKWELDAARNWDNPGFPQTENDPVVCVSWNGANKYISWLNEQTGGKYRLPTEAEWEYSARSGKQSARFWGETPDGQCRYANGADKSLGWKGAHDCEDGFKYTAPVESLSFQPNAYELYHMLGNAWEWTCSEYDEYDGSREKNCAEATGGRRVIRGGSWTNRPDWLRSAARDRDTPDNRNFNLGFRLAQDID